MGYSISSATSTSSRSGRLPSTRCAIFLSILVFPTPQSSILHYGSSKVHLDDRSSTTTTTTTTTSDFRSSIASCFTLTMPIVAVHAFTTPSSPVTRHRSRSVDPPDARIRGCERYDGGGYGVTRRSATVTSSSSRLMAAGRQVGDDEGVGGRNRLPKRRFPVVPLIGPIITAPPLMIGGEMSLDPPTPLQWRTLQECVVVHRNELLRQERDGEEPSETTTATIGAAPIVAFIDDTTATS